MQELTQERFYFIRHGKTEWNDKQLCQGQKDIPLSSQGKEEIRRLCHVIKTLPFSMICTSPLKRALESALIIQAECQRPLSIENDIQERSWGLLEGISSMEMYRIEENEEKDPAYNPGNSIELRAVFKNRVLEGLNKALMNKNPLIVSHGRVFLALCDLMKIPIIRQIPNASIIECEPREGKWHIQIHEI